MVNVLIVYWLIVEYAGFGLWCMVHLEMLHARWCGTGSANGKRLVVNRS
jgi:hypothetical protein